MFTAYIETETTFFSESTVPQSIIETSKIIYCEYKLSPFIMSDLLLPPARSDRFIFLC